MARLQVKAASNWYWAVGKVWLWPIGMPRMSSIRGHTETKRRGWGQCMMLSWSGLGLPWMTTLNWTVCLVNYVCSVSWWLTLFWWCALARHLPPRFLDQDHLPRPVILDSYPCLSPNCKLLKNFKSGTGRRPWVICSTSTGSAESSNRKALENSGATIIEVAGVDGMYHFW